MLLLGDRVPAAGLVGPVVARPADRVLAQEVVADAGVHVEPEDVARPEDLQALVLDAAGVETEQAAEIEPFALGSLVEGEVEVAEGVDDDRARVELADGLDLLGQ